MFLLDVSAAQISSNAPMIVWGCIALVLALAFIGNAYEKVKTLNSKNGYVSCDEDEVTVSSWRNGTDGISPDGVPFYHVEKTSLQDYDRAA